MGRGGGVPVWEGVRGGVLEWGGLGGLGVGPGLGEGVGGVRGGSRIGGGGSWMWKHGEELWIFWGGGPGCGEGWWMRGGVWIYGEGSWMWGERWWAHGGGVLGTESRDIVGLHVGGWGEALDM